MADWVALAGIASTALVAVAAQVGTALTTRGDRKHTSQLDFEKRVWEAKSAALVSVIAKCQRLKDATELHPSDVPVSADPFNIVDPSRKFKTMREIAALGPDLYDGIGADLLAYADESVTKPFAELSKLIRHKYAEIWISLEFVDLHAKARGEAKQRGDDKAVVAHLSKQIAAETKAGRKSDLDVDALVDLCDRILYAARKDLRGN